MEFELDIIHDDDILYNKIMYLTEKNKKWYIDKIKYF